MLKTFRLLWYNTKNKYAHVLDTPDNPRFYWNESPIEHLKETSISNLNAQKDKYFSYVCMYYEVDTDTGAITFLEKLDWYNLSPQPRIINKDDSRSSSNEEKTEMASDNP